MKDLNYSVATTMISTVAEFRRYADIADSEYDRHNTLIQDLIYGNTMRLWERFSGDKTSQNYSEYYDVDEIDQNYVVANHTPVTGVVAMTLHVPGGSDTAVDADDIWYDDIRIGIVERFSQNVTGRYAGTYFFGKGVKRCWVTYTAGVSTAKLQTLKMAIWAETAAWLNRQGLEGMKKVKMGAADYEMQDSGWCALAETILMNWGA